jgi:hypothetical protein
MPHDEKNNRVNDPHRNVSRPIVLLRPATPPGARSPGSSIDRIVKDRRQVLPSRATGSCKIRDGTGQKAGGGDVNAPALAQRTVSVEGARGRYSPVIGGLGAVMSGR